MLPILVITYIICEQSDRMEALKIKNVMYKLLTAAALPDWAMQDIIIIRWWHKTVPCSKYHM